MSERPIIVGAVAYDPKVVPIWEAMRDYFREANVPTDYVLFSNYEAQVDALFARSIDIAWNTNVAYVRTERRAGRACQVLAMRDTDIGFTSRLIARSDAGIAGIEDLRGKRLAVGSADSAQAALVPLQAVRDAGLDPDRDLTLLRFDLDVGKHGDTGTSELEVLKALHDGEAHAPVGDLAIRLWARGNRGASPLHAQGPASRRHLPPVQRKRHEREADDGEWPQDRNERQPKTH